MTSPAQPNLPPPPKFAIGAEVFLLDCPTSSRNASAGIPTFLVQDNSATPPAPAPAFPASATATPTSSTPAAAAAAISERLYTLTPSSMVFQVAEPCLLSAEGAFKIGDIVRQKTALFNAVVEKRYVVGGKVRYDVKDELETVAENVARDGDGGVNGLVKVEQGSYWPIGQGGRR